MTEAGLDELAVEQLIESDIEAREMLIFRNAVSALLKLILIADNFSSSSSM